VGGWLTKQWCRIAKAVVFENSLAGKGQISSGLQFQPAIATIQPLYCFVPHQITKHLIEPNPRYGCNALSGLVPPMMAIDVLRFSANLTGPVTLNNTNGTRPGLQPNHSPRRGTLL
jgi:hypothetical protein